MSKKTVRSNSKGASRRKSAETSGFTSIRSFSLGLLLGVFLCLFAQQMLTPNSIDTAATTSQPAQTIEIQEQVANPGPNIDFPTRLRNSEVLVPAPAPAAPREPVVYYLQAASFRSAEDANRARAELLLLNLEAEITEFDINGQTWHRIIVGPFEGQSRVSKAQTTLLENGYGGMVLQRKK